MSNFTDQPAVLSVEGRGGLSFEEQHFEDFSEHFVCISGNLGYSTPGGGKA